MHYGTHVVRGLAYDAMVASLNDTTVILLSDTLTDVQRKWFELYVEALVDGSPFGLTVPLGHVAVMMEPGPG